MQNDVTKLVDEYVNLFKEHPELKSKWDAGQLFLKWDGEKFIYKEKDMTQEIKTEKELKVSNVIHEHDEQETKNYNIRQSFKKMMERANSPNDILKFTQAEKDHLHEFFHRSDVDTAMYGEYAPLPDPRAYYHLAMDTSKKDVLKTRKIIRSAKNKISKAIKELKKLKLNICPEIDYLTDVWNTLKPKRIKRV